MCDQVLLPVKNVQDKLAIRETILVYNVFKTNVNDCVPSATTKILYLIMYKERKK